MKTIPMDEAKKRLEELSAEVNSTGQMIGLTQLGQLVVKLAPPTFPLRPPAGSGRELAEEVRKRQRLPEAEAQAFGKDVEVGIEASRSAPEFNPWAS